MATTRRHQITTKTLLLIATLSAFGVLIWLNRPSGLLLIEINVSGAIQLNGKSVPEGNVAKRMKNTMRWHKLWGRECEVVVSASRDTPTTMVTKLIENAQIVGLEKFSVRVLESLSMEN